MPNDYVSDYEELTGLKPLDRDAEVEAEVISTKVVAAPGRKPRARPSDVQVETA